MDNRAKENLDNSLEELAASLDSPDTQARLAEILSVAARFHNYSPLNQWLIGWSRPSAMQVAGFHRWLALGRHVKKGAKGIAILAPCTFNKKTEKDGEEPTEKRVLYFRTVWVFDVADTEGKELPDTFSKLDGNFENVEIGLTNFCIANSIAVGTSQGFGLGVLGVSMGGSIALRGDLESARRTLVLAHEIGHELLHRKEDRKNLDKTTKESDAEAVAFVVGKHFGLPTPDSGVYIRGHRGDAKLLRERFTAISKAAGQIIDYVEGDKNAHTDN